MEEDEETSTSKIEGEDRSLTPEQEEPSTSGVDEEEASLASTSIESSTYWDKIISIIKNKYYIICFECKKNKHYKSKCLKLMKKKIQVAPKEKEKSKEAKPMVRKGKEHIVFFSCNQQKHYYLLKPISKRETLK